jgi:heme exporter protein D
MAKKKSLKDVKRREKRKKQIKYAQLHKVAKGIEAKM